MDTVKIEELYKQIAKTGADLQNLLTEAQKKNGAMELLFVMLQSEINKSEVKI